MFMFFWRGGVFHLVNLSLNGLNLWAENGNVFKKRKQFVSIFVATGIIANENILSIKILQYRFFKKTHLLLQI